MANFEYAGIQAGKKISGEISASDPKAAAIELRKKKNNCNKNCKSHRKI